MTNAHRLIPTTIVGSYPQPTWLVDPAELVRRGVPRTRAEAVWRLEGDDLVDAQDAAALLAINDQIEAGLDVVTDGEVRRESYFNHFANSLGGVDPDRVGEQTNRIGTRSSVPLVTGPITWTGPVERGAAAFLRRATAGQVKVTVPGPFTLSQLAQDEYYGDQRALALAYADAVRCELLDLASLGIDVVQIDEPYLQANADAARRFAVEAIDRALDGVPATTVVHTCYGYAIYVKDKSSGYPFLAELASCAADQISIEYAQPALTPDVLRALGGKTVMLGVLDLSTEEIERPDAIAAKLRAALEVVPAERLVAATDCGMKFLPRRVARGKLRAMAEGAAIVRAGL